MNQRLTQEEQRKKGTVDIGTEFEEEVREFLKNKLGFKSVKGGPSFHIASPGDSNQIDACGRFNDILFIFECKAAGRKTKKDLRKDILATRERARTTLKYYKTIPEYSKCNFCVFVFITKKITIPDVQIKLLEDNPLKIWYEDENTLEYYSDLHGQIGEYAVYNFLADFGIRPPVEETLKVSAIKTRMGQNNVYSFFAKPKELLKYSYVARRRSNKENFYQRMLEKSRMKKIQGFLDKGGVFPTNIVISIKKGEQVYEEFDTEMPSQTSVGLLEIKNSYNACWIVDGQHRLYAFSKSKSNIPVPCIAFDGLSIEDERSYFLEINKEQKPIQADLIWDLEGLAHPDTSRGIISNTVRTINYKDPLRGKIYIPVFGSRAGRSINMTAFCNGIMNAKLHERVLPNLSGKENPIFDTSTAGMVQKMSGALINYIKCIELNTDDNVRRFLLGNAGIPILLYLFEPIVSRHGKIPNKQIASMYGSVIGEYFRSNYSDQNQINKLKEEANSEQARKNIAKDIGHYIRTKMKDQDFWPKMEQSEIVSRIIAVERRLGVLISNKLSELGTNWEATRLPDLIWRNAKKRMEKEGTDLHENFDLGDESQIILLDRNWNQIFKKEFVKKDCFENKDELKVGFTYLSKIRNPRAHGKSTIITKDDLAMCNVYLNKFDRILPAILPVGMNSD